MPGKKKTTNERLANIIAIVIDSIGILEIHLKVSHPGSEVAIERLQILQGMLFDLVDTAIVRASNVELEPLPINE